jgi:hypothetical protein
MAGSISPGEFARVLRSLQEKIPDAIQEGLEEAGLMLQGKLVQGSIASTEPHQPVDTGQYKSGWRSQPTAAGAVVFNTTKQALWMERGRGPGPVPFAPIREWVRRKKIATGDAEIDRAAHAIQRSIARVGIKPRWVLRRAIEDLRPELPKIWRRKLREIRP